MCGIILEQVCLYVVDTYIKSTRGLSLSMRMRGTFDLDPGKETHHVFYVQERVIDGNDVHTSPLHSCTRHKAPDSTKSTTKKK